MRKLISRFNKRIRLKRSLMFRMSLKGFNPTIEWPNKVLEMALNLIKRDSSLEEPTLEIKKFISRNIFKKQQKFWAPLKLVLKCL